MAVIIKKHSIVRDRQAISSHYDVSNDFYKLWLDRNMVYSCGYFKTDHEDLDRAQIDKLDHICRKLQLRRGETLLDIGCGWGALVLHAAQHYGVKAHGITISRNQHDLVRERIECDKLTGTCTVELRDYREIPGEQVFDKIVSVGMFEHVGIKNLPIYFRTVQRLLKEKGLFLNHGITTNQPVTGEFRSTPEGKFMDTYVFPDGELDTIDHVQKEMRDAGFEILDVECLRPHYAKTLRLWARNLKAHEQEALRLVDEKKYRTWLLYITACAVSFEDGGVSIYQILGSKHTVPGLSQAPLTRAGWYIH